MSLFEATKLVHDSAQKPKLNEHSLPRSHKAGLFTSKPSTEIFGTTQKPPIPKHEARGLAYASRLAKRPSFNPAPLSVQLPIPDHADRNESLKNPDKHTGSIRCIHYKRALETEDDVDAVLRL